MTDRLHELLKNRAQFVKEMERQPITTVRTLDGSEVKVRPIDPITDRMDWDNEREIARVRYEIHKVDELLHPTKGRPREPIYESALRDLGANPSLTIADLARTYLPAYFPDRKDSAIEVMRQGLRRARRKKIENIP